MIRLGLIGCGGMAKNFVDRFGQLEPTRMQVTAAVDVVPERARAAAEAFGNGCRAATDYSDVLGDIDAALLVLPHHLHHPVALGCLQAGKHVMVEKPMANSEAECLDLIAAAKQHDRILMVAYVMRYHPLVAKLKELLDSGQFGPCFHMAIWTEQFTQYPVDHWAMKAETLGGGQLFSHGCHYIDLLLWFLGQPIEGTHVGTNFGTPWMEREGTSNVALKFENGATGYHFGTWGARGTRLGYAIHAHCTEGMLEVDFRRGQIVYHRFNAKLEGLVEPHIDGGTVRESQFGKEVVVFETAIGKQTDKELSHFLSCIEQNRQPETDGPASLQGLRVIWQLYEAEQQGRVADLRGLGLTEAAGSAVAAAKG